MSNRKIPPSEIKNSKLKHLATKYYRSETEILLFIWRDKKANKPVIIVSKYTTKGGTKVQNRHRKVTTKPNVISDFNNAMNNYDRNDQMVSYYNGFNKKTIKWWKSMFV